MQNEIQAIATNAKAAIQSAKNLAELEVVETRFIGRKQGELTELMKKMKDLAVDERKQFGVALNELKQLIETELTTKKKELAEGGWSALATEERVDITQPALPKKQFGHLHPNTLVQRDLEELFTSMGFMVLDGPELESDYYNFTALNIPETHPARDMQDTFYIKGHSDWVMRTQTSTMQVRAMQKYGAPLRVIVPGKCFRNEATDARHEHTFYQLEGLVVDQGINFSHLKGVFQVVADHLYGPGTKIRLMPKFYPFVEPGVRGELSCSLCIGKGCRVCKNTGWLEAMPGGMVHPNVLRESGVDPSKYQGFAFGFGLTRLAMLKYGIDDVRLMESGNLKFLEQF